MPSPNPTRYGSDPGAAIARRIDWRPAVVVLVVLALLAGSPALQLGAALVFVTGAASSLWARFALRRLTYRRVLGHSHVFAGEQTTLAIHLKNDKPLPLIWVNVEDRAPQDVELVGRELPAASDGVQSRRLLHSACLGAYGEVTWRYTLECPARGWYRLGPAKIETSDPFGLYDASREDRDSSWLVVYPAVRALEDLGFPTADPFGGQRSQRPLIADPLRLAGVRDYRPEDSRRLVHWKASARRGDLQVKQLEPVATATLVLVVDMATMDPPWLGNLPYLQEQAVAVAASITHHAHEAGYAVGIAVNGSMPGTGQPIRVGPARGEPQLRRVLEALAAVGDFAHPVLPRLVAAEARRAPWGATLVVVTAVETAHLGEELLRLRRAGRRVVLVSLDEKARRDLPGVLTYRLAQAQVARAVFGRG